MISEALELRMEGGRVSDCWCRCVVSRGLGGGRDGGVGWHACMTMPSLLVACREMPEYSPSAR